MFWDASEACIVKCLGAMAAFGLRTHWYFPFGASYNCLVRSCCTGRFGPMDKASASGASDSRLNSRRALFEAGTIVTRGSRGWLCIAHGTKPTNHRGHGLVGYYISQTINTLQQVKHRTRRTRRTRRTGENPGSTPHTLSALRRHKALCLRALRVTKCDRGRS